MAVMNGMSGTQENGAMAGMQPNRSHWEGEINANGIPTDRRWNEVWPTADNGSGRTANSMPQTSGQAGQNGWMAQNSQNVWSGSAQMSGGAMPRNNDLQMSRSGRSPQRDDLQMQHSLPSEVIESPVSMNEAYLGSLKATLLRNRGNFIVATFLIGTQSTMSWEGILYEVGNDFVTIYQPGRDRYVVCDIYSLKYMEFYDTRRREMCDMLLQGNGMQNGGMQNGGMQNGGTQRVW